MRSLIPIAVLVGMNCAHGQPPPGYYDAAQGLQGEALREALYHIIAPHTVLPNNGMWGYFEWCDARPNGTVWDMYSDVPGGTPAYTYQFGTDQCGQYSGEGDCFNREHSFPQDWYDQSAPMSTDLFHVYPTDAWVNQKRGNLAYGTVGAATWSSSNGSKVGPCDWPLCNATVFEPIDAYKGDFARTYFYMLTRYLPAVPTWGGPMLQDGGLVPWARHMLLAWHSDDPVSSKETARNNCVFGLQGNRNPYIDQPEWVEAIWGEGVGLGELVDPEVGAWYNDGMIHLHPELSGPVRVWVIDPSGRMVWQSPVSRSTIDVPALPSGVYAAIILHAQGRRVLRFIP